MGGAHDFSSGIQLSARLCPTCSLHREDQQEGEHLCSNACTQCRVGIGRGVCQEMGPKKGQKISKRQHPMMTSNHENVLMQLPLTEMVEKDHCHDW